MKKTKTLKTIFSIVVALILLIILGDIILRIVIPSFIKNKDVDANLLQYYYAATGCMYLMDENDIEIDEEYKNKVESGCRDLFNGTDYTTIDTSKLSRLIFIDNYFNFGNQKNLFSELDKRYDETYNLFSPDASGITYDNSSLTEEDLYCNMLDTTHYLYKLFSNADIEYETYDLLSLLADSFNQNISKFDINDAYGEYSTLSDYMIYLFFTFLDQDHLDMIEYESLWEELKPTYHDTFYELDESLMYRLSNLIDIQSDSKLVSSGLYADLELKYTPQEYYLLLDSDEEFGFSVEDTYATTFLYAYLRNIYDIDFSENQYFTDNINRWLSENYEYFLQNYED